MNNLIIQSDVYPISQARGIFGTLVDKLKDEKTILFSKKGKIKAALVDFDYLKKLQEDISQLYQKTYIDKKLISLTRIFSKKEISKWLEEDKL
ncbi:MAG: hypothetical protein ACD_12C00648G0001 [uncultured bacterium]|nr:MAG: hypothetical protein ACD_12C00648G0001 [uncultured bacterium]